MDIPIESERKIRFGEFEINLRTRELCNRSRKLILQEQPFQILAALLERPGQLVSRDELTRRLWPSDTYVDFEHSLNKAVNRLREALEDSAEHPRLIETLPRRGYRFIARVASAESASVEARVEDGAASHLASGARATRHFLFPLGVLGLTGLLATWVWFRKADAKPPEPSFQRLSFERGIILSARFAPDGQSIVYGAAWDGKPFQLFLTKMGSFESRSLGVEADILAVSPEGEMAVLLDQRLSGPTRHGTLALLPIAGSAPRRVLDNVQDADWSPDGSKLVVAHYDGGQCALEFPPGEILYQSTGGAWLSSPRVSPRGDQIAFLDHPLEGDDAGFVAVIDLMGHKATLSQEFQGISGLAWDPAGDAVWTSGSELGPTGPRALFRVTTEGRQILVRRESGDIALHDISRDGHLLLTRDTTRGEVFGRIYPDNKERELAWRNNSYASDLSPDGTTLLLAAQEELPGVGYEVYLRRTDGSPAFRLGDGEPWRFSRDGKWAVTSYPWGIRPTSAPQLRLLPTGTGTPVTVTRDAISHGFATLLPDGERILFEGSEPGRARRNWVQDVIAGKPQPITPEGTVGTRVSPDGKLLVAADLKHRFWLYPVDGGSAVPLSGVEPGDEAIQWSADGEDIFVASGDVLTAKIYRIQISSGHRQLIYTLIPNDTAGLSDIGPILVTPDGKSYIYSDYRVFSDLYLVGGLR